MKSYTLVATLFSVSGLAAVINKKQSTEFDVFAFYAGCVPHSTYCSYSFNVTTTPGAGQVACSAFLQGPDYLPAVNLTSCSDPSVSFSFAVGDEFALTVTTGPKCGKNVTGIYTIPSDEFVVDDNGAVSDQRYDGPLNFTITDLKTGSV